MPTTHSHRATADTALVLYAFPINQSLADWTTYRVLGVEAVAPNLGRYLFDLDSANGVQWAIFEGASQPAGFYDALPGSSITLALPTVASGLPTGGLPILDANGRTNANVTAAADGVLTAAKFGASALATQPVASVTGAVGSVTGNVGGNVTGTVGSVVGAVGSVTGNVGGSVASVSSTVTANVVQISGDSTAADNLELALEEVPGEAGGLPLLNAGALMDANLSTVANVPQTSPAGGFASQTLLNSVNSTANNLTSAVDGLPTLTRIELDDNSTQLAAILADTGTDIPDAINNIAVDPETIITAMEEAGFAKESEPGAIEEGIEGIGSSGTFVKDEVNAKRTWSWPKDNASSHSPVIVTINANNDGDLCFDLTNLLNPDGSVLGITSVTCTPSSGITVGAARKTSNGKKVLFPASGFTNGSDYVFTITVTTTDGDDALVGTGKLKARNGS